MKRSQYVLLLTGVWVIAWTLLCLLSGSDTCAQTEPALQAPQAAQTAQDALTGDQQATALLGQAVQGFLLYAPTTEAQRKLAIDSYNTVKAAMDRLAALEKPAPVATEETKP